MDEFKFTSENRLKVETIVLVAIEWKFFKDTHLVYSETVTRNAMGDIVFCIVLFQYQLEQSAHDIHDKLIF